MKPYPSTVRFRQLAPLALVLVSAVVAVIAYWQALDYPFMADDTSYIVANKGLAELHLTELWRLLVEPYNPSFEFLPLRDLSYWIDLTLFGQNPVAFRLHNILLYLLCLPLVYATTANLWRYFRPADVASASWAAATVTALFAVHPALVESVVWISGRKYILPDFFSMLAFWLAVHVKREQGFSSRYAVATLVAFVAVMFSKSSYAGVAPIIAVLWLIFWRDIPLLQRRRSLLLWPFAILVLAVLLLLVFIINNKGFDTVPAYLGIEAVIRSLAVLGGLTRIAVSPEARHYFHPVFEDPWLPAMVGLGVTVLCAAGWGVVMLVRKRSLAGFALIVFLLLCLPYLQLVPAKPPSLVADRYVALAIWPTALLLVLLAWRFKPLQRTALLLLFALPCVFQTLERPSDWRNIATFLEPDLRAYPGHYLPSFYMITVQMRGGLTREASETASHIVSPEIRNVMTKLIQADRVMRINAVSTGNPHEAMNLLLELGRLLEQPPLQSKWDTPMIFTWLRLKGVLEGEWQFLAQSFPNDVAVNYNAGSYMLNFKSYKGAAVYLRAAIETNRLPGYVRGTAFKNLGYALLASGRLTEAEAALRTALVQSPPDLQAYCVFSDVYKLENRLEDASRAETNCLARSSNQKTAQ
jgi:tetratricopeptide (TPR) repeat protein